MTAGRHVLTAAIFDTAAADRRERHLFRLQGGGGDRQRGDRWTRSTRPGRATPRAGGASSPVGRAGPTPRSALCAERILVDIATRAFRAPQTTRRPRHRSCSSTSAAAPRAASRPASSRRSSRILIDPRFLFRFEAEPAGVAPGMPYAVSDLELASRLSFFLWSSIPDPQLIDLAVRRTLHRPAVLAAQVRRMLADPRAACAGGQLRRPVAAPARARHGDAGGGGLRREPARGLHRGDALAGATGCCTQDRPVTELLTADYTFLERATGAALRHHGRARLALPQGAAAAGQPAAAACSATAASSRSPRRRRRTSPVIRGSWILENLLSAPRAGAAAGRRDQHRWRRHAGHHHLGARSGWNCIATDPSCASCHNVIDPVGFALENFDAIGAWRERDGDTPVDAQRHAGRRHEGRRARAISRRALMSHPELFVTNVTEKLMTYALGRALEHRRHAGGAGHRQAGASARICASAR